MLGNLRDKIQTVQHDLSASLKQLRTSDVNFSRSKKVTNKCRVNAGAELLNYYQNNWNKIHKQSEKSAYQADVIGQNVSKYQRIFQNQRDASLKLVVQLETFPELQNNLMALMTKIGELEGVFEEVEFALINLEDVIETQQLQEKELEKRFQLAMYERGKQNHLEHLKVSLADAHQSRLAEFEKKQKVVLRERQDVFQAAFEEELSHYKAHGKIERVSSVTSEGSSDLASINLATESEQVELDKFLEEALNEPDSKEDSSAETTDFTEEEKK